VGLVVDKKVGVMAGTKLMALGLFEGMAIGKVDRPADGEGVGLFKGDRVGNLVGGNVGAELGEVVGSLVLNTMASTVARLIICVPPIARTREPVFSAWFNLTIIDCSSISSAY
jgi:hypothetical protein